MLLKIVEGRLPQLSVSLEVLEAGPDSLPERMDPPQEDVPNKLHARLR
jgi:hypothetical protein